jgi:DNA (cytosine-5)-methyltransferase 1
MKENIILEKSYQDAEKLNIKTIPNNIQKDIDVMIKKMESNKSLVSAIITSLIKKISSPKQDIRLHRVNFANGYSARVLDTKVTTPFLKDNFPKYANKESAFLTLAIREQIKWTKEDGQNLKIRDKELKSSFLNVFEQIEVKGANPEQFLKYLLFRLIRLSKIDIALFEDTKSQVLDNKGILNINLIIDMLSEHFKCRLGSRLPVIAIYSIYEILLNRFERYKDKQLIPLKVRTSSDKHGFGDIEIYTKTKFPFEIVEIKHNIPIDKYLILDVAQKTKDTKIDRYYVLTTFKNSFKNKSEKRKVFESILNFKKLRNIDIIANGIVTTLKYYLRFIDSYDDFLKSYTKNLIGDAESSTEVKGFHLSEWSNIKKKYFEK